MPLTSISNRCECIQYQIKFLSSGGCGARQNRFRVSDSPGAWQKVSKVGDRNVGGVFCGRQKVQESFCRVNARVKQQIAHTAANAGMLEAVPGHFLCSWLHSSHLDGIVVKWWWPEF